MQLDRKKLALVHVAKAKLALAEDDYRAILRREAGVGSAAQLDAAGFKLVMTCFERLGFVSDAAKTSFGGRRHWRMASPGQVGLIRHLWREFTDGKGTDASLDKWLARTFKVSALRFLPADAAQKAIGALNGMIARKAGKAGRGDMPEQEPAS